MGAGYGIVRGLTKGLIGAEEGAEAGKKEKAARERQARLDLLQEALQRSQITRNERGPAPQLVTGPDDVLHPRVEGQPVRPVGGKKQGPTPPKVVETPEQRLARIEAEARARRKGTTEGTTATRVVPASIKNAVSTNQGTISAINDALNELKTHQNSIGLAYNLPDWAAQRLDPDGVNLRRAIADVGSQKIHERSGASVTVAEAPRLRPFIPAITDRADAAEKKLRAMLRYLEERNQFMLHGETEADTPEASAEVGAAPVNARNPVRAGKIR